MTGSQGRFSALRWAGIVLALLLFSASCWAQEVTSLVRLREIQSQIAIVAAKNTPATVLVSDGIGSGSGVIVSPDGLVLTAGHVLTTGGSNYRVVLSTGRELSARPLGKNLNFDAGMVQITEPGPWPCVELGDKGSIQVGDWCVCLGNPGGFEIGRTPPVRAGKILEKRPSQLITDCALIGGDSGGPLFDLDGKLIGIHSSISDSIAVNRHVSVDIYRTYWDRMLAGESWGKLPDLSTDDTEEGKVAAPRAGIGVSLDLTAPNAKVLSVRPNSVADKAGIKAGDVIVDFNGQTIQSAQQVIDLIAARNPGLEVTVSVERSGQTHQFQIKLEAL
jgi:serine protease Do